MPAEPGITVRLRLSYPEAFSKTIDALKSEGFGVLTEIDVQTTLKKKLDVDFRQYKILGACNPPLAHRALSANLDIGLLLPCNITVYEDGKDVVVTAIDPLFMLESLPDDPAIAEVAREAREKLQRAIQSLSA